MHIFSFDVRGFCRVISFVTGSSLHFIALASDLIDTRSTPRELDTPEATYQETQAVLSKRILQHDAFSLVELAEAWTRHIDNWELRFWETHGFMPTNSDKMAIVSWYDSLELIETLLRGLNSSYVSSRFTRRSPEDEQLLHSLREATHNHRPIVEAEGYV